jgi:transcriptional regulator with XRE-family HTH domain
VSVNQDLDEEIRFLGYLVMERTDIPKGELETRGVMLLFHPPMRSLPQQLGDRLRELREEAGLSAADVAAATGYTRVHLWAVERGEKWPSPELLGALAVVYRVQVADLFAFADSSARHKIREVLRLTPNAAVPDLWVVVKEWAASRGVKMPDLEKEMEEQPSHKTRNR